MSDSLLPNGLQHIWLPCPSLSPRSCSNSCPLNWWCYLTISSSVITFFSCFQSLPASGSFPVSWFFTSCGQSIGTLASVFPTNIQGWFHLELTDLISLQSKGLSRVFSNTIRKYQFFSAQLLYGRGNGKLLQYSCHENSMNMNNMKRFTQPVPTGQSFKLSKTFHIEIYRYISV